MFSFPGIALLLVWLLLKPQEYFTSLRHLPLLYLLLALAVFGYAVDLRLRRARPFATPQLIWVAAFFGWCLITVAVSGFGALVRQTTSLLIPISLFLLIAHGVQTFRAFEALGAVLLAITLFLSFVGVHQGFQPLGCFQVTGEDGLAEWDGRSCVNHHECENDGAGEPGADYACERVGLFGTQSVGGRVRYLGTLKDPNELAMVIAVCMPLAFAFAGRRKTRGRQVLLFTTVGMVGLCTVLSQSRGGQLVFLAVIGAYVIRRYGLRGIALGAVLGAPMLIFGGRDTNEAAASSQERLQCWHEGMAMFREHPILGVGQGQFTEHHFLTAHNSFVLAPAELGLPGMILWSTIIYLCMKIPLVAMRRLGEPGATDDGANVARTWAMALFSSWIGMLVGMFLLSFCYKEFLWAFIGLSGAFYSATRAHDPGYEVKIGWSDLALVAAIDVALIGVLIVYTAVKAY